MFPAYVLTIGLIGSLVLLLVIMLILIVSYHDMVKKFRYSQRENTFLKNHLHERSVEVLDSARSRALSLLEEAEQKAKEIVSSAENFHSQSQTETKQLLEKVKNDQTQLLKHTTDTLLGTYTSALQQTELENSKTIMSLSESFEKQAQTDLQQTEAILQKEAGNAEKFLETTTIQLQLATEKEIAAYKAERLKKVDDQILQLLNTVAQAVFSTALPLDEHQKIVIDALETAKKDLLKN